jgi:hypothetical protein
MTFITPMKTIVAVMVLAALPIGARADAGTPAADKAAPISPAAAAELQALSDRLALTPEELEALAPILEDEASQRAAIGANKTLKPQMKPMQLQMVHQYALGQIKQVLSPARFAQLMQGQDYLSVTTPQQHP